MNRADLKKLATYFMESAVRVKPGQKIWVEHQGPDAFPLALACIKAVEEMGGIPYSVNSGGEHLKERLLNATPDDILRMGKDALAKMQEMSGYIRVDEEDGLKGFDIPQEKKDLYYSAMELTDDYRVNKTRWLVTSAPSAAFAKACGQDLPAFEQFYNSVCLLDYSHMRNAAEPLARLMRQTDRVHIKGRDTDLTFSIKGIGAEVCAGEWNIPDGECFSAPVRNSANGTIRFGASKYLNERFEFIQLTYKDGKIVNAVAENPGRTAKLNAMLNTDEGSRYIGEFAIAFNPRIKEPMGEILFDEKIDLHARITRTILGKWLDKQ